MSSSNITEISVCDMHTGGEPLRIITGQYPDVIGQTVLDKCRYQRDHLDYLRRFLMFEPRGHADMYGAVIVEPDDPSADFGVLFMHNEGYSTMCGHGVIALARYAVDNGMVERKTPETRIRIQAPCGTVEVVLNDENQARFTSVPSFVVQTDLELDVPEYGLVHVDVAYGGAFYAILPIQSLGLDFTTATITRIRDAATAVKNCTMKRVSLYHPQTPAFLYGTILTDGLDDFSSTSTRNVVVFADSEVDRSPCGSGVSARLALQYHKQQIKLHQIRDFENPYTKSTFKGEVLTESKCGDYKAVVVAVTGTAYYTGTTSFKLEDGDRLGRGFLLK